MLLASCNQNDCIIPDFNTTTNQKVFILEQQDLHKRLLLALVLSFVVLLGFNYLMPKPPQQNESNRTKAVAGAASTPVATSSNAAPKSLSVATAETAAVKQPKAPGTAGKSETLSIITAKNYIIKIDKLGRISSTQLLKEKYRDEEGNYLELFDPARTLPLELRFSDSTVNAEAFQVPYTASADKISVGDRAQTLILTQTLSGITVVKKLTFYADGHYDIDLSTSKKATFFLTPGRRPETDHSMYMIVRGALVRDTEGILTTVEDGKAEKAEVVDHATIVSSFDRYDASLFYNFDTPMHATISVDAGDKPLPFVKGTQALSLHGYVGPKEWRTFEAIHPDLVNNIEFGWFTFLSKPFFRVMLWIHDFVGNWGWAIILFTLLVKLILFPLSYKGMMSMNKMRDLAPKMKELKEKYGKDPAKMNQQTMAMYKKHGANPMGGCLPMLLQIPVFFALYRVLLNADELQGAPWIGWIVDLSDKDPFYILPVLMGVSMFFQQKITPNTMTDPMQKKIFQWFPVIMTFFFLTFPAGLVLYWLTNNLLSIAQQYFINVSYEKYKNTMKHLHSAGKEKE